MRLRFRGANAVSAVATILALLWLDAAPLRAQPDNYTAPRTADGRPDLNGIWQALNTANYDLETHPARPALALVPAPPRAGRPGLGRATPVDLPAPALREVETALGRPRIPVWPQMNDVISASLSEVMVGQTVFRILGSPLMIPIT